MTNMIQNPALEICGVTMYNAEPDGDAVVFNGGSSPSWVQFDLATPMVADCTYTLTLSIDDLEGGTSPQIRLPAGSVSGFYNLVDGANEFICRDDLDNYSVLQLRASGANVTARLSGFALTE